jgi:HPt (histidine-containing phosphotransfer) domain-containing protein
LGEVIERWWPKSASSGLESGERMPQALGVEAAPAAEADGSPLDPNVRRSDAVARVFLKHVPDQVATIGRAIATSDLATLKSAAHKLKGSCLAVGVPRMAALCASLEEEQGDAAEHFAELERVFARAQSELSAQLAGKAQAS